jgi:hypothetical protein
MNYLQHLTQNQLDTIIAASDAARAEYYASIAELQRQGIPEGLEWTHYPQSQPAVTELRARINALPPEARYEPAALMWFGRGDDTGDDLTAYVRCARQRDVAAGYIASKNGSLAEYLRNALVLLALIRSDERIARMSHWPIYLEDAAGNRRVFTRDSEEDPWSERSSEEVQAAWKISLPL